MLFRSSLLELTDSQQSAAQYRAEHRHPRRAAFQDPCSGEHTQQINQNENPVGVSDQRAERQMQPVDQQREQHAAADHQIQCGNRNALRRELRQFTFRLELRLRQHQPCEGHNGEAFERFTDEGPMALLPLPDNRCALVWTRIGMDAQRLANLDERSFLSELQGVFGYRLGTLKQVGARHLYPLTLVEAEEQVRSHLAILGNAAHSLHPIAGQGFNLSLRDANALAEALLAGPAVPGDLATLQRYRESQHLDQKLTVGFSDQVTRLFGSAQPLVALGRNMGLLGLDLLPPAKRWFARQAMGLGTRPDA